MHVDPAPNAADGTWEDTRRLSWLPAWPPASAKPCDSGQIGAVIAAWLRAEQVIYADLGSARLDSQHIATLSGISRSKPYRLFENEGGVAAHVRRVRLHNVFATPRDPDQNGRAIHAIAASVGFHHVASCNRAFKARFSASPGEVRAGQHPADQIPARGRFERVNFLDALFDQQTRSTTHIFTAVAGR